MSPANTRVAPKQRRPKPTRPATRVTAHPAPATDLDPFEEAVEAYARSLFLGTTLRRLERNTLVLLEDADLAQAWARTVHCAQCDEDADLDGDHIRRHLRHWLATNGTPLRVVPPRAPVHANLRFLTGLLGLSTEEAAVFQFLVALHHSEQLKEVAHSLRDLHLASALRTIAAATRLPLAAVTEVLRPGQRLLECGLVKVEEGREPLAEKVWVHPRVLELLLLPELDQERFLAAFVETAKPPTLERRDFADQEALETAIGLLREAVKTGAPGINILLHGPTGVGKTELASLIGRELGLQVLAVGRADSFGDSASPPERLSSLSLALRMAPRGKTLLLFDELEDLFRWDLSFLFTSMASPQMSKQWFGAMLEDNPVPIIWCTNRVGGIDPAFLRRFTFAISMKAPGARQRARILAKHAGGQDGLGDGDVEAIAQRFDASPAQFASAARGARLLAGDGPLERVAVERLLAPVHTLITGEDATLRPVFQVELFVPSAICCGEDLASLAERIARFKPGTGPGISLCLYGPPGTGKSELVKYLAHAAGRTLVSRRASDLMSKYVGETEQNIAQAFAEARQEGAVLLFDEADSYLRDRSHADRAWEVTQVNEFLQQLEVFPGIVACTTNLWREIDEAALRRFVIKLEFRYPTLPQRLDLFRSFFPEALAAAGEEEVRRGLAPLESVAPGDFAAVARCIRVIGAATEADELIRRLAAEVAVKRSSPRSAGFGR